MNNPLHDFMLRYAKRTIKELLEGSIRRHPHRTSLANVEGESFTYFELGRRVGALSSQLKELGVTKGDKVAILGENSPHWGIAYLAVTTMGAVVVPILPDFPSEDIKTILNHSDSRILFATRRQIEKISFEYCRTLRHVIALDDFNFQDGELIIPAFTHYLDSAVEKASSLFYGLIGKTGLISQDPAEDDLAAIIYTSGTTGLSKGVMLTHKNIVSDVVSTSGTVPIVEEDRFFSMLPLSHAYECTLAFLLPLSKGSSVYYSDKAPTPQAIKRACEIVKPTVIGMVPLIIEKIYKKKVQPLLTKNLLIRGVMKTPLLRHVVYRKAAKKIFEFLGGKLKFVAFGGAAMNSDVETFMKKGGFPYVSGYGLTETAPLLTGELVKETRLGSCGYAIPEVSLKIVDPDPRTGVGEIWAKGPNVMKGYYKNKSITDEVLTPDGWFKTGDLGLMDGDGFLFIKGRSKNMFLGSSGENIYPEVIEEKLNSHILVQESLAVENDGHVDALVNLDFELLEPKLRGLSEKECERTMNEILEEIREETNTLLPPFSRIRRCYLQEEPFEKTATKKIKRYLYHHKPLPR